MQPGMLIFRLLNDGWFIQSIIRNTRNDSQLCMMLRMVSHKQPFATPFTPKAIYSIIANEPMVLSQKHESENPANATMSSIWICKNGDETSPDSELPLWCWDEYWWDAFHGSLYHNIPFLECDLKNHFPLATVQIQTWDENRSIWPSRKPQRISCIEIRKLSTWQRSRTGGEAWVRLWCLVPC